MLLRNLKLPLVIGTFGHWSFTPSALVVLSVPFPLPPKKLPTQKDTHRHNVINHLKLLWIKHNQPSGPQWTHFMVFWQIQYESATSREPHQEFYAALSGVARLLGVFTRRNRPLSGTEPRSRRHEEAAAQIQPIQLSKNTKVRNRAFSPCPVAHTFQCAGCGAFQPRPKRLHFGNRHLSSIKL
jgi:hypothetical protein